MAIVAMCCCFLISMYLIFIQVIKYSPYPNFIYHASAFNWMVRAAIISPIAYRKDKALSVGFAVFCFFGLLDEVFFSPLAFTWFDVLGVISSVITTFWVWEWKAQKLHWESYLIILAALVSLGTSYDIWANLCYSKADKIFGIGDVVAMMCVAVYALINTSRTAYVIANFFMGYNVIMFLGQVLFKPLELEGHEVILLSYLPILATIFTIKYYRKYKGLSTKMVDRVNMAFHLIITGALLTLLVSYFLRS